MRIQIIAPLQSQGAFFAYGDVVDGDRAQAIAESHPRHIVRLTDEDAAAPAAAIDKPPAEEVPAPESAPVIDAPEVDAHADDDHKE